MSPYPRRLAWALALVGVVAALTVALCSRRDASRERSGPTRQTGTRPELAGGQRVEPRAKPGAPSLASSDARELIRGRVVDPESGPLSEGRLDVHCLATVDHTTMTTTIGEEGEFVVRACPSGPTCLRLTHPSVEQPQAWELEADGEVELEAQPAARLSGTIRSPAGELVADAGLLVSVGASRFTGRSDSAGEYAVALPRSRPCDRCDVEGADCGRDDERRVARVLVSAERFAPQSVELSLDGLGSFDLDLDLEAPGPPLTGRVLGLDGDPFDARTRVLASNVERDQERHAATVDDHGRFSFEALAGDAAYALRAIRDEREIATLSLARPGDRVELRASVPARGSRLTLELVDGDGEAIAGARIDGGPFRATVTDAAGRVEAESVLPGRYTVRVRRHDCAAIRELIELAPDAEGWVRRLQLPENC